MRIGVPTEVKSGENRVALTPSGALELTRRGHAVAVQHKAGLGSSFTDDEYRAAGATIVDDPDGLWAESELILKVKEPVAEEYPRLRDDLALFTYLHLAANEPLVDALLAAGTTGIAYETVQLPSGQLPLLYPMSEVAGCMAPQVGAGQLLKPNGGRGILLGGIAGIAKAKVVIIGAGVAGQNAANMALGLGADVTLLDTDLEKLRQVFWRYNDRVHQLASSTTAIAEQVADADLVIGTVLIPGARAPKLVTDDMVAGMRHGSVLVDVAIDQGGCFENSRPTTHDDPTFRVHNSLYYCVANMPAAVPNTSTRALTNSTMPYVLAIAEHGWRAAMAHDPALALGLNTHAGRIASAPVAEAFGRDSIEVGDALAGG